MAQFEILTVDFDDNNELFIEIHNPERLKKGTHGIFCPDDVTVVPEGEPIPPVGFWVPKDGVCYTVRLLERPSDRNPSIVRYEKTGLFKPMEGDETANVHMIVFSKNGKGKTRRVRRISTIVIG